MPNVQILKNSIVVSPTGILDALSIYIESTRYTIIDVVFLRPLAIEASEIIGQKRMSSQCSEYYSIFFKEKSGCVGRIPVASERPSNIPQYTDFYGSENKVAFSTRFAREYSIAVRTFFLIAWSGAFCREMQGKIAIAVALTIFPCMYFVIFRNSPKFAVDRKVMKVELLYLLVFGLVQWISILRRH